MLKNSSCSLPKRHYNKCQKVGNLVYHQKAMRMQVFLISLRLKVGSRFGNILKMKCTKNESKKNVPNVPQLQLNVKKQNY